MFPIILRGNTTVLNSENAQQNQTEIEFSTDTKYYFWTITDTWFIRDGNLRRENGTRYFAKVHENRLSANNICVAVGYEADKE